MLDTLPAPGPLLPLSASTFAGMLVRMSVFDRVPEPWVAIGQLSPEEWDDDLFFCRQLAAAGVQVWGDATVQFGHTTDVEVWPHYDAVRGWSMVLARSTVPFLLQPWGRDDVEPVGQHDESADVYAGA